MQIISEGDNLHEISKPIFGENEKNISKCLLKFSLEACCALRQPGLFNPL